MHDMQDTRVVHDMQRMHEVQGMQGGHTGHDAHSGHVAMFRDRFWISLLLTIPTLAWGDMLEGMFAFSPPRFPGSTWIPAVFGSAVFLYGGTIFIKVESARSAPADRA